MKKLFESRAVAAIVLIVVCLLAVPLLGGLKLGIAKRSAEKKFAQAAAGNGKYSLSSDAECLISNSSKLLDIGEKLTENDQGAYTKQAADKLKKAIDDCSNADTASKKFSTCLDLIETANTYYGSIHTDDSSNLDTIFAELHAYNNRIHRTYKQAFSEYDETMSKLTTGFPASLIAKLFNIGG